MNQFEATVITLSICKSSNLRFFRTDKLCFMQLLFWNFFYIIAFYIVPYDGCDNDLTFQENDCVVLIPSPGHL